MHLFLCNATKYLVLVKTFRKIASMFNRKKNGGGAV